MIKIQWKSTFIGNASPFIRKMVYHWVKVNIYIDILIKTNLEQNLNTNFAYSPIIVDFLFYLKKISKHFSFYYYTIGIVKVQIRKNVHQIQESILIPFRTQSMIFQYFLPLKKINQNKMQLSKLFQISNIMDLLAS